MSGSFVGWVVGCVGLWGFFYVFWLDSGRAATGEPGRGSPHLSSSPRAHVEGQASARPVLPWRPVTQRRGLNLLREVGQGTRGRESSTANARGVPPNPPTSLAKATYGQQQTPREGRKGAGGGRRNDRTRVTVGTRLFFAKAQVIQRQPGPLLRYAPIRSDLTRDTQWVGGYTNDKPSAQRAETKQTCKSSGPRRASRASKLSQ